MEMVFCYQNCSDLMWEKIVLVIEKNLLKFKAEGREFATFLRSLEQSIQTVKGQNNLWWHDDFLTCSWRFLISHAFWLKFFSEFLFFTDSNIESALHCENYILQIVGKIKKVILLWWPSCLWWYKKISQHKV